VDSDSDILEKFGFEVSLSNPGKTRLIAEAKNKTDKVDAKTLARLLRADMLFTCYVRARATRKKVEICSRSKADAEELASYLGLEEFLDRDLNKGFSGGDQESRTPTALGSRSRSRPHRRAGVWRARAASVPIIYFTADIDII